MAMTFENTLKGKKQATTTLAKKLLYIMRSYIPIDTGNMTNNAVYYQRRPNGFAIVFDEKYAPYMKSVNEGRKGIMSSKQLKNINFVERSLLAGVVELSGGSDDKARRINKQALGKVNLKPAFKPGFSPDKGISNEEIEDILSQHQNRSETANAKEIREDLMKKKIDLSNLNFMKHEVINKPGNENATRVNSYLGMARALARWQKSIGAYSYINAESEEE